VLVNWQAKLEAAQQQQQQANPADLIPRCPLSRCPGIFSKCGAVLRWVERQGRRGFWACANFKCDYRCVAARKREGLIPRHKGLWGPSRPDHAVLCCVSRPPHRYFPAQQVPRPELGCEIVDQHTFRLAPQPGGCAMLLLTS
jgi:hypothetical protein